jgi:hypothetical protein
MLSSDYEERGPLRVRGGNAINTTAEEPVGGELLIPHP